MIVYAVGLLLLSAAILAIVSVSADRPSKAGARIATAIALVALVLLGSLAFAQRQVCTTLGGNWASDQQTCRNEWGGNGNGDAGSNNFGQLFDPRR